MESFVSTPPADDGRSERTGGLWLAADTEAQRGLHEWVRQADLRPIAQTAPQRDADVLLTSAEAAKLLGISPSTLAHWRSGGLPCPPVVRLGERTLRYRRSAVLAWAASREVAA